MILLLVGCRKEYAVPENSSSDLNTAEGHYFINQPIVNVYPYDGRVYCAGDEIGYYTFEDGGLYRSLSDQDADSVYADESGIYLLCPSEVVVMAPDGTVLQSCPSDYRKNESYRYGDPQICVTGEKIVYAYSVTGGDTDGFCLYTIDKATGEVSKADLTCENPPSFAYSIFPSGKDVLLVCPYEDPLRPAGRIGVYRYSPDDNCTEFLYTTDYDLSVSDLTDDGTLYICHENINTASRTLGYLEDGSLHSQRIIGLEEHAEAVGTVIGYAAEDGSNPDCRIDRIFYTGTDCLLWDSENGVLSVYDIRSGGETLTVIRPVSYIGKGGVTGGSFFSGYSEEDMVNFSVEYDCRVESISYPADEYENRLRMKLLAGDKDFDIVYFDDSCGAMLPAILNYGLYLPLEKYESVAAGFERYMDGVREIMTCNWHLIGVPFTVSSRGIQITERYAELGLPELRNDWTQEDFWKICDAAVGKLNSDESLILAPGPMLLEPIIQQGAAEGQISHSDVLTLMKNLKKYYEAGVLSSSRRNTAVCCELTVPAQSESWIAVEEEGMVVSVPLYQEKKYAAVQNFVFAASSSQNPDLAVKYLEMLLSPEHIAEYRPGISYLLDDMTGYFEKIWPHRTSEYPKNQWAAVDCEIPPIAVWTNQNGRDALAGAEIAVYDSDGTFMQIAKEVMSSMLAGEITPETAADEIVREAEYRFME